jgi:zinc transporter ZupT
MCNTECGRGGWVHAQSIRQRVLAGVVCVCWGVFMWMVSNMCITECGRGGWVHAQSIRQLVQVGVVCVLGCVYVDGVYFLHHIMRLWRSGS